MATRYWVGGTGTWDTVSTTNWSTTSGGSGGASAPTSSDDVILDANSGSGTITASGVCAGFTYASAATIAISGYASVYGTFQTFCINSTALNAFQVVLYGPTVNMGFNSYIKELDIIPSAPSYTATATGNIYATYLNVNTGWTLNLNGNFVRTHRVYLYGTITNGTIYYSAISSLYYQLDLSGVWSSTTVQVETGTYPATLYSSSGNPANYGAMVINATSQVYTTSMEVRDLTINAGATLTVPPSYSSMALYVYGNLYIASGGAISTDGGGTNYGTFDIQLKKVPGSPTITRVLRVDGNLLFPLDSTSTINITIDAGSDLFTVPGTGFGSNAHPAGAITAKTNATFTCSTIHALGFGAWAPASVDVSALSAINTSAVYGPSTGFVTGNCAFNMYNYRHTGTGYLYVTTAVLDSVTLVDAISVHLYTSMTIGDLTCASSLGQGSTMSLALEPGTTLTVTGNFVLSGASSTDRVNLTAYGGGPAATISKASGTVTASYANISYSNATGGATFKAPLTTNIDGGNNTGWIFGIPGGGNFFAFF